MHAARRWASARLADGPGRALAALGLAAFAAAAWYPFRWDPPRTQANGVTLTAAGVLAFTAPGLARLRPSDGASESPRLGDGPLVIAVRARPAPAQIKAAILTVSCGRGAPYIVFLQNRADLIVRIAEERWWRYRLHSLPIADVFADGEFHTIELRVEPGRAEIRIDGTLVRTEGGLATDLLATFECADGVTLGNNPLHRRPWLGELTDASVQPHPSATTTALATSVEVPPDYSPSEFDARLGRLRRPHRFQLRLLPDYVLNLLVLMPVGFALVAGGFDRRGAVSICLAASVGVESGQLLLATCFPSLIDVVLNTAGGACGAWLAVVGAPTPSTVDGRRISSR